MKSGALFLLTVALLSLPALAAEPLVGNASVIDGDTIEIHGQRIRLHGIDAPESRQECSRPDGTSWRCGQQAALALSDRIARSVVHCDARRRDRYGRITDAWAEQKIVREIMCEIASNSDPTPEVA